jgi:hypothetical protein
MRKTSFQAELRLLVGDFPSHPGIWILHNTHRPHAGRDGVHIVRGGEVVGAGWWVRHRGGRVHGCCAGLSWVGVMVVVVWVCLVVCR